MKVLRAEHATALRAHAPLHEIEVLTADVALRRHLGRQKEAKWAHHGGCAQRFRLMRRSVQITTVVQLPPPAVEN